MTTNTTHNETLPQNVSTLYVILKWNANILQKTPCEIDQQEIYLHANCANRSIVDVPQSLTTDLQSLDLSYNKLKNLDDKAFEKYTNLVKLTLNKMQKDEGTVVVKNDAFRRLYKLEFLDISNSFFNVGVAYEWPSNLKILIVNNNKIKQLKLGNLKLLEKVEANDNELQDFPHFNVNAPLTDIEIENNPLDIIHVMDVAPLCQLKRIRLKFKNNLFLQNERHFCDCKRLESWLKTYHVDSPQLNCTEPEGGSVRNCALDFTEPEIRSRQECLARIGKDVMNPTIIIYIMIGALVVILLLSIYIFVKKFKKFASARYNSDYDNEDRDDHDDYDDGHYDD